MATRLQTLIAAAQELSLLEQFVQAQHTQPIIGIEDLRADFWPQDESADDFIEYIYQQRREDRLRA